MRMWVHRIWLNRNSEHPLNTLSRDEKQIEKLIREHGERTVATAWALYVYEDPPKYNLEPVEVVARGHWKNGDEKITTEEDWTRITRFPLAAFLAVAEGYLVAAEEGSRPSKYSDRTGETKRILESLPVFGQP